MLPNFTDISLHFYDFEILLSFEIGSCLEQTIMDFEWIPVLIETFFLVQSLEWVNMQIGARFFFCQSSDV